MVQRGLIGIVGGQEVEVEVLGQALRRIRIRALVPMTIPDYDGLGGRDLRKGDEAFVPSRVVRPADDSDSGPDGELAIEEVVLSPFDHLLSHLLVYGPDEAVTEAAITAIRGTGLKFSKDDHATALIRLAMVNEFRATKIGRSLRKAHDASPSERTRQAALVAFVKWKKTP